MNDEIDVFDLDDDELCETPEQRVTRQAKYIKDLTTRILLRTHKFLTAPNANDLEWLLDGLAKYTEARGREVASDQFVLLTWHKATCAECAVDEDGAMDSSCARYDEYVDSPRWMSPNFPVEDVNE